MKKAVPFLKDMRISTPSLTNLRFENLVDWQNTRAYYSEVGGIRINLEGREPAGWVKPGAEYESLREDLQRVLTALEDPETGLPIFENVYKREDLYWGPHVERAPDLIVNPTRDDDDPRKNYAVAHNVPTKDMSFLDPSNLRTGNHTLDGIFIAFGDGVCRDVEIDRVSIMDLAPTVLYTMGLPVPEDMDGKILRDIFE